MKEEEKTETRTVDGPGRLLREEREKKGLTLEDVAERTRLRPKIIKDIEDEDWDGLPSTAFVRGFLKTYAKVLSIDENRVLEIYGRKPAAGGGSLRTPGETLRRRRKGPFFLLCLLGAVAVFALWKNYGPPDTLSTLEGSQVPMVADPERSVPVGVSGAAAVQEKMEENAGERGEEHHEVVAVEIPAADVEIPENEGPHRLKGKVHSRTWVKIYVDDLTPREYMFQPGQQPEWTANRGFYLIIGNANGIDLEWNGREVPALGNAGQVVRLSLPEEFRHRLEGN
jgi:hypothetical protein